MKTISRLKFQNLQADKKIKAIADITAGRLIFESEDADKLIRDLFGILPGVSKV